jgi:hypothetical protein
VTDIVISIGVSGRTMLLCLRMRLDRTMLLRRSGRHLGRFSVAITVSRVGVVEYRTKVHCARL